MTTLTKQLRAIRAAIEPGSRTRRACSWDDVRRALRLAKTAKRRVRVYSRAGFVPNRYKWRCDIQHVEVTKTDAGLLVSLGWGSALRTNGAGSLDVVQ